MVSSAKMNAARFENAFLVGGLRCGGYREGWAGGGGERQCVCVCGKKERERARELESEREV